MVSRNGSAFSRIDCSRFVFMGACVIGGLWFLWLCVAFDYALGGSFGVFDPAVRRLVKLMDRSGASPPLGSAAT